ncbi:MAG: DUF4825 domain-containing protein, partial [Bacilli bacterium]|nr:DUF4825 domain-containing protein [Bacilli bacterium]
MNQDKIGKFILECRKAKKLTQSELAEKLGVTDKSISNWENGRNMPDLSLFKPLCKILDITINDLISGEKVTKDKYQAKLEENIISTIDYTNKKMSEKNNFIGIILIVFGIMIAITAMTIFPSESSWGSIYSVLGGIVSLIGISRFSKKLNYRKRLIINFGYFVLYVAMLFLIDYISVVNIKQAPRFSYSKETGDNMIIYKAPLYNVYRINRDTKNEYYIIDTKKIYTEYTVPITPFNRYKSGIDNIIKYKNNYVGNNSNTGNLINNLPLSEYGYVFEIDSVNLELTVDYYITDWYINENHYLEKSLLYNSVSIFSLIDNVEELTFNFSGKSYKVNRKQIEELYPNYNDIVSNEINKNNFNKYLENKMN